ncbi:MAG: undecaprenyl-diphosphate phosphatase [Alphaproteobacteria bacterium]|nr:undecaprenyl-diphosphate phosphatase [Alphaproteobacteria bacterium]
MNNVMQTISLGLVQGVTEFLPISSSAHLILFPEFFNWSEQGILMDVALHFGTLLAAVVYYWRDCAGMAAAVLTAKPKSAYWRLAGNIAVAVVPAVIAGVLLSSQLGLARERPILIALNLIVFGVLLWLADKYGRKDKGLESMDGAGALMTGLAQAAALVPGVSRSGITLTALRLQGYRREQAARFTFLLAIPTIFGATAYEFYSAWKEDPGFLSGGTLNSLMLGIAVSFIAGMVAIRLLIRLLARDTIWAFAVYRVIIGVLIIALYWRS